MTASANSLAKIYKGWDLYQQQLVNVIGPLTAEQLDLRAGPELRSVGEKLAHVIAVRARWLLLDLHEGEGEMEPYLGWDGWSEDGVHKEPPARSAAELVTGLEATWGVLQRGLERWTPDDLNDVFPPAYPGEESFTRQYVIWHLIEHDLHHGGEASIVLGAHGIPALEL
ncbi:MAG: DinB family protein [Nitrolancea sp.]